MKRSILLLALMIVGIWIIVFLESQSFVNLQKKGLLVDKKFELQQYLELNEVVPSNFNLYSDANNKYYDLIEIYNPTDEVITLEGVGLSDDPSRPHKWTFENGVIEPKSYIIVFAVGKDNPLMNGYYANFKLNTNGGKVSLAGDQGNIIDALSYGEMQPNMSIGKSDSQYVYFYEGTPGKANEGEIVEDLVEYNSKIQLKPTILPGIYSEPIDIGFINAYGYDIRITIDGSDPSYSSMLYKEPMNISNAYDNPTRIANIQSTFYVTLPIDNININKGTVIKAQYFNNSVPVGNVFTGTYFIWPEGNERYSFPVVSLTSDSKNLFDPFDGIYVVGEMFYSNAPNNTDGETPANYNQRGREWEREANIEYYNNEGKLVLSQNIGIRIFGGWSRANVKKSFKLLSREEYSDFDTIENVFFDDLVDIEGKKISSFETLLLRSGGNDYEYTLFRDVLVDQLVGNQLIFQAFKPVILFLNGEYWGVYHIREHMDEDFIANHYNLDKDFVNIITIGEDKFEVYSGEEEFLERYNKFIEFVSTHDMMSMSNYQYVKNNLDITNFIDYYITQMYISNKDWPGNNQKIWSVSSDENSKATENSPEDGRFRYLLYDTEFSFGLYEGKEASKFNSFKYLLDDTYATWSNPQWSTLLFRNLITNSEFRQQFIIRFCNLLNSRYSRPQVIKVIEELQKLYEPEMEEYFHRWNFWLVKDINIWNNQVELLKEFATNRSEYLFDYAMDELDLQKIVHYTIVPFKGGKINCNNEYYLDFPLDTERVLTSYLGYPITLTIETEEGYVFQQWIIQDVQGKDITEEVLVDSKSKSILVEYESDISIRAIVLGDD